MDHIRHLWATLLIEMSNDMSLDATNQQLRDKSPKEIMQWALSLDKKTIVTTNFGPYEGAILHLVSQLAPSMPVVCVDHGYNTEATYRFAEQLNKRLNLNMHYYTPKVSAKRRAVLYGGIPSIDDAKAHEQFTQEVKLEPFGRAMSELTPQVWFTAIRKEQTAFRQSLDILSQDQALGILKVAPFFHYSELDMEEYLVAHDLPIEEDYHDPTKVLGDRECGLHVRQ